MKESIVAWAHTRVEAGLLKPLQALESHRSRFSRERPPPQARRIRIEETTTTNDASGHRSSTSPSTSATAPVGKDDMGGCVYGGTGKIFVKVGDQYCGRVLPREERRRRHGRVRSGAWLDRLVTRPRDADQRAPRRYGVQRLTGPVLLSKVKHP